MAHAITQPTIEQAREMAAAEYRAVAVRSQARGQHDHARSSAKAARRIVAGELDFNPLVQRALAGEIL